MININILNFENFIYSMRIEVLLEYSKAYDFNTVCICMLNKAIFATTQYKIPFFRQQQQQQKMERLLLFRLFVECIDLNIHFEDYCRVITPHTTHNTTVVHCSMFMYSLSLAVISLSFFVLYFLLL